MKGTRAQHTSLLMWIAAHFPEASRYVHKLREEARIGVADVYVIAKFPGYVDAWLLVNCPYPWVIEQLITHYRRMKPKRVSNQLGESRDDQPMRTSARVGRLSGNSGRVAAR